VDVLARDVTLAALSQGLSALNRRQELLAQNIANANTPGYKRRDIAFSTELAAALGLDGTSQQQPRALRVQRVMGTVAREVVEERLFYRADLGGVDIDREMAEQAKNTMQYAALAQLTQDKFQQYRMVIREGRV
jgi:flagellar basal-body rod protein FlgB